MRIKSKKRFLSPNTLMVQGTTSDAGKSAVVTALCRIFARKGYRVAPFKPQNMALNSAVTEDGGEIGRAQAVQALAAGIAPSVLMNPVLLKPNSELGSQVIVKGKAIGNMQATDYHRYKPQLLDQVVECHRDLSEVNDYVLVEGAGSPAEINLREHDIANMGFAEAIDCPVIIVADIDRGGVFAHLYGTYALLSQSEQERVIGFVINRFRGDVSLLDSGLAWLEEKTGVPTLAVIPYLHNFHLEAEDSLNTSQSDLSDKVQIRVAVIKYPRTSNHTDFDALMHHPDVHCEFVQNPDEASDADWIILPGSKNVRGDLEWLKTQGWPDKINQHLRYGGKVFGICGGYQMLGKWIHDPDAIESSAGSSEALGLLDFETTLEPHKVLSNVSGLASNGSAFSGYEIHAGRSSGPALNKGIMAIHQQDGAQLSEPKPEGAESADGLIAGAYIHGLFDEPSSLECWLAWAGCESKEKFDYQAFRLSEIERLADSVEEALGSEFVDQLFSWEEVRDQTRSAGV